MADASKLYRWQCTCSAGCWKRVPYAKAVTNATAHARRCSHRVVTITPVEPRAVPTVPVARRPVAPECPNPEAWRHG